MNADNFLENTPLGESRTVERCGVSLTRDRRSVDVKQDAGAGSTLIFKGGNINSQIELLYDLVLHGFQDFGTLNFSYIRESSLYLLDRISLSPTLTLEDIKEWESYKNLKASLDSTRCNEMAVHYIVIEKILALFWR